MVNINQFPQGPPALPLPQLDNATYQNPRSVGVSLVDDDSTVPQVTLMRGLVAGTNVSLAIVNDDIQISAVGSGGAAEIDDLSDGYHVATNMSLGQKLVAPSGTGNLVISGAAPSLTTGSDNTIVGESAGAAIAAHSSNTFIGADAGIATTCNTNTVVGADAMTGAVSGNGANTIIGQNAGNSLTTGFSNTFIGKGVDGAATVAGAVAIGVSSTGVAANALVNDSLYTHKLVPDVAGPLAARPLVYSSVDGGIKPLTLGSTGDVLTVNGTNVEWAPPVAGALYNNPNAVYVDPQFVGAPTGSYNAPFQTLALAVAFVLTQSNGVYTLYCQKGTYAGAAQAIPSDPATHVVNLVGLSQDVVFTQSCSMTLTNNSADIKHSNVDFSNITIDTTAVLSPNTVYIDFDSCGIIGGSYTGEVNNRTIVRMDNCRISGFSAGAGKMEWNSCTITGNPSVNSASGMLTLNTCECTGGDVNALTGATLRAIGFFDRQTNVSSKITGDGTGTIVVDGQSFNHTNPAGGTVSLLDNTPALGIRGLTSDQIVVGTGLVTPVIKTLELNSLTDALKTADNIVIGSNGSTITTGIDNTIMCSTAIQLTTGSDNTVIGNNAIFNLIAGSNNTGVGAEALLFCNSSANTAIGHGSGNAITSGANNICIGVASTAGATNNETITIGNGLTNTINNSLKMPTTLAQVTDATTTLLPMAFNTATGQVGPLNLTGATVGDVLTTTATGVEWQTVSGGGDPASYGQYKFTALSNGGIVVVTPSSDISGGDITADETGNRLVISASGTGLYRFYCNFSFQCTSTNGYVNLLPRINSVNSTVVEARWQSISDNVTNDIYTTGFDYIVSLPNNADVRVVCDSLSNVTGLFGQWGLEKIQGGTQGPQGPSGSLDSAMLLQTASTSSNGVLTFNTKTADNASFINTLSTITPQWTGSALITMVSYAQNGTSGTSTFRASTRNNANPIVSLVGTSTLIGTSGPYANCNFSGIVSVTSGQAIDLDMTIGAGVSVYDSRLSVIRIS